MKTIDVKYDIKGNIVYIKTPEGNESWYEYDSDGHLFSHKDSNGTEFQYDAYGNLTYSKDYLGFEEWRQYNKNNQEIYRKWRKNPASLVRGSTFKVCTYYKDM